MYKLYYKTDISCGHYLKDSESLTTKKCLQQHGHQYKIEINIQTSNLNNGMVIDFGKLKEIIYEYDHRNLNDFMENPTTETFAYTLWHKIHDILVYTSVLEVTVWESEKGSVTYSL